MPIFDKATYERFYRFNGERWGAPAGRPRLYLHYNDWSVGVEQRSRFAPMLATAIGAASGAKVVIIGAGFGWTCEGLTSLGIQAAGTDISPWVIAEKGNTEEALLREYISATGLNPDADKILALPNVPGAVQVGERWEVDPLELYLRGGRSAPLSRAQVIVAEEDLGSNGSRRAVERLLSGLTHIVTEEVLNSIDDTEGLTLCDRVAQLSSLSGATVYHVLSPAQPLRRQAPELNWKTYTEWRTHLNSNGFTSQRIVPSVTTGGAIAFAGWL